MQIKETQKTWIPCKPTNQRLPNIDNWYICIMYVYVFIMHDLFFFQIEFVCILKNCGDIDLT